MNPDDILYHYTSADALLGMLGAGGEAALWMTQIHFMNDDAESWNALNIALGLVYDLANEEGTNQARALAARQRLNDWGYSPDRVEVADFRLGMQRTFAFCVTTLADVLSQWRGYAPSGGYAVGFRYGDLQKIATHNKLELRGCEYDANPAEHTGDRKKGAIRREFKAITSLWDVGNPTPEEIEQGWQRILEKVAFMAGYFKDGSFAEEHEYRLVGTVSEDDPRARWRAKGAMIIPYCEIPLKCPDEVRGDDEWSFPIRKIIIGPGLQKNLARHALEALIRLRRYEIAVADSACTLRI